MLQTYPLATLYEARQRAVESAESLFVQRTTEYDVAVQRASQAAERLVAARARVIERAKQELEFARQGCVIAHDLQAGATYRWGAQLQFDQLAREAEHAGTLAAKCRVLLDRSRHEVVLARQELAIVDRHRQNFLENMRKVAELRSDENAAEVWQANRLESPPTRLK